MHFCTHYLLGVQILKDYCVSVHILVGEVWIRQFFIKMQTNLHPRQTGNKNERFIDTPTLACMADRMHWCWLIISQAVGLFFICQKRPSSRLVLHQPGLQFSSAPASIAWGVAAQNSLVNALLMHSFPQTPQKETSPLIAKEWGTFPLCPTCYGLYCGLLCKRKSADNKPFFKNM